MVAIRYKRIFGGYAPEDQLLADMQPFFQTLSHSTTHGIDRTDREQ